MDPSKRKRPATDESTNGGDRRRARRSSGDERAKESADHRTEAVSDAEVEEFYEILQRMKATRCAAAAVSGSGLRMAEAERLRWRPSFVWEDFEEGDRAVKDDGEKDGNSKDKKGEAVVRVRGLDLDLNEDPEPEGGDCTARCAEVEA